MTDRNLSVTQGELHAYVDGELAADRHAAVEAWLASHPEDAATVAEWQRQADSIRNLYGSSVSETVPERLMLDRLAHNRRQPWKTIAAAVIAAAFVASLVGGVAGWFARGALAAVPASIAPSVFERTMTEAIEAHKLYVVEVRHPVEVPGTEREHLLQWLSKRLNFELRAPDLEASGLTLVGGRLLPGPSGQAAAFFMYESASGERFTLYFAQSGSPETGMRYRMEEAFSAFYWVDRGVSYVIIGPADRQRLWAITKTAYDQIDKPLTPGG